MEKITYTFNGTPHEVVLSKTVTVIGRSETADVTLVQDGMSRTHFELKRDGESYFVRDLGSSNGTFVNGQKIGDDATVKLKPGDKIGAASILFLFGSALTERHMDIAETAVIAKVEILDDDGKVKRTINAGHSLTIGRKETNDAVIDDPLVSGEHCAIEKRGGTYILKDLGSSNGTYVGGMRITESTIKDGEEFLLGKEIRIRFMCPPEPPPVTEAPTSTHAPSDGNSESRARAIAEADAAKSPWGPAVAVMAIVAIIAIGAAFVIPHALIEKPKEEPTPNGSKNQPVPVAKGAHPDFSFAGSGDYGGWAISVAEGTVKAALTESEEKDGGKMLALRREFPNGDATDFARLTIITTTPVRLDLGPTGAGVLQINLTGDTGSFAASTELVVAAVDGEQRTPLGTADFRTLRLGTMNRVPLTAVAPLGAKQLQLTFLGKCGAFAVGSLAVVPDSLRSSGSKQLETRGAAHVFEGGGVSVVGLSPPGAAPNPAAAVSLQPVVLSRDSGRQIIEGWVFDGAKPHREPSASDGELLGLTAKWTGVIAGAGSTTCRSTVWPLGSDAPFAGFAVEEEMLSEAIGAVIVRAPVAASALVYYDTVGNPIPVKTPTDSAIGPLRGIGLGGTHIYDASSKPDMRVEIRNSTANSVELLLFHPPESRENRIRLQVFCGPALEFFRYASAVAVMEKLAPGNAPETGAERFMGSAALERALFLKSLPGADFEDLRIMGDDKVTWLTARADAIWKRFKDAQERALRARREPDAREALTAQRQFRTEFPGDGRGANLDDAVRELNAVVVGAGALPDISNQVRGSTPVPPTGAAERAAAEEKASNLLVLAKAAHAKGNWLLAHLYADNIAYNLHYTKAVGEAAALAKSIEASWDNAVERDAFVKAEMDKAGKAMRTEDTAAALAFYRGILTRYPRCPEAPEIRAAIVRLD